MNSKNLVFVALMTAATAAHADKPAPVWERSPEDQYQAMESGGVFSASLALDQYGDKLHEYGRWGAVRQCFKKGGGQGVEQKAVLWALCGDDLKAIDPSKLESVMHKESFRHVAGYIGEWKKLGDDVEAQAKNDPGVLEILKQTAAAKADWTAFEAKNRDALLLYKKLKDGIRAGKDTSHFDGCWAATEPAFTKLVKATRFQYEVEGERIRIRIEELETNGTNYLVVANYGLCAASVTAYGAPLAREAVKAAPGIATLGWRTMLIAKLLDPKFKPKFADRNAGWESDSGPTRPIRGYDILDLDVSGGGGSMNMKTGELAKVTKKDDTDTVLAFKGEMIDSCLVWADNKKNVVSTQVNGDPMYERVCKKRGKVAEQLDDITVGTKFAGGLAKGVNTTIVELFPVEAWNFKTKKFVAILGVPVKGSPAEKPLMD